MALVADSRAWRARQRRMDTRDNELDQRLASALELGRKSTVDVEEGRRRAQQRLVRRRVEVQRVEQHLVGSASVVAYRRPYWVVLTGATGADRRACDGQGSGDQLGPGLGSFALIVSCGCWHDPHTSQRAHVVSMRKRRREREQKGRASGEASSERHAGGGGLRGLAGSDFAPAPPLSSLVATRQDCELTMMGSRIAAARVRARRLLELQRMVRPRTHPRTRPGASRGISRTPRRKTAWTLWSCYSHAIRCAWLASSLRATIRYCAVRWSCDRSSTRVLRSGSGRSWTQSAWSRGSGALRGAAARCN